jgi:hypothetical protein
MAYDTETVLQRYKQMLTASEFDPEAGTPSNCVENCGSGSCQNCCVGLVEMVRNYSEQLATVETQQFEFDDVQTLAKKLGR